MSTPKKVAASLAILAAVGAFMSFGVFSLFSSTQTNSSTLSSATFGLSQLPSSLLTTVSDLIPGDSITRCVELTNSGSVPATLKAIPTMTNGTSSTLNTVVTMQIDEVFNVDTASSTTINNCTVTSGHTLSPTNLMAATAGNALPASVTLPPTTGTSWAASEVHFYRVQITLPDTVTSFLTYGGKSVTANVNFQADQLTGTAR